MLVERADQDFVDQTRLARAADARHATEHAQRHVDRQALEVVDLGVFDLEPTLGLATLLGNRDELPSGEIRAGQRFGIALDLGERADGEDAAALGARAGPDIDDHVGLAHRVLVVLDHDQRVAQIAQRLERGQEAVVVALMETDRGLVEDVEHADERAADLRREPDALGLPARERGRAAREVEVAQSHVGQETEPRAHFFQNLVRDQFLARGSVELAEEFFGLLHRHRGDRMDVLAGEGHRQRLGLEARALTRMTRVGRHELLDLFLHVVGRGLGVPALEVVDHALELRLVRPRMAAARLVRKLLLRVRTIEQRLEQIRRHLIDRRRHLDPARTQQFLDLLHVVWIHRGILAAPERLAPGHDRAVLDRLAAIGNHLPRIDLDLDAETGTVGTSAVRRVERKEPGRQFFKREAAIDAGQRLRERQFARRAAARTLRRLGENRGDSAGKTQRGFDRVGQPLADVGLHDQTIDDHLDRVLLLLVEVDLVAQFARLAVDPDAREALFLDLLEELGVLALASANHRREQLDARALGQLHHLVDDLFGRLRADLAPAVVAMRLADARVEQAQIIVNLGDRADRRARVARGRLLIDRNGRR